MTDETSTGLQRIVVDWHHDLDEEPVLLYSEFEGSEEVRKVDVYRDGRSDFAGPEGQTGKTFLSWEMPSIEAINVQIEFDARSISASEFDRVYLDALRSHGKAGD